MPNEPEAPQSRNELWLNEIAGHIYDTTPEPPQSRTEKWLKYIAENGGGGGGGGVFIVEPFVTAFDDVLAAYNAGKTLISVETKTSAGGPTEYLFGNLNYVGKDQNGDITQFEFLSASYFPTIIRYLVSADDGWIESSDKSYGFAAWYNDTTFAEVMEAFNAGVPIELREYIEEESTEEIHRAQMTLFVADYATEMLYFEFTCTEIKDGQTVTTRYRLNENDEYTKTVNTSGRLVLDEDERLEDGHDISKYVNAVRKFERTDSHGDNRTLYAPFTGTIIGYDSEGEYAEAVIFELTFEDPNEHHTAHIAFYLREDSFNWEHVYLQETNI